MPAVVRGGRRQSSNQPAKRGAAPKSQGRGRAPRNAQATPGKMAALGRLDLSPRAVIISIVAGVVVLAGVLATGARAERIGASFSQGVDGVAGALRGARPRPCDLGAAPRFAGWFELCRRPPRTTAGMRRPPPSTVPGLYNPSRHGRPARD